MNKEVEDLLDAALIIGGCIVIGGFVTGLIQAFALIIISLILK